MLRFSLAAWLKLQLLCHAGDTEIGAFAVTSPDDPLYVLDLVTIKQSCTCISVEFDDEAVADFFDEQVDAGRPPDQFFRIWVHTHPGDSPLPSCTDEETFQRVFGTCDWAVMFILARTGATYCRLRVNTPGPRKQSPRKQSPRMQSPPRQRPPKQKQDHEDHGRQLISLSTNIPCEVDYASIVGGDLQLPLDEWMQEYARNVSTQIRWWEGQDRLTVEDERLFHDEIDRFDVFDHDDQDDLVDQLLELDDEALRSLMESLEEQGHEHEHEFELESGGRSGGKSGGAAEVADAK